MPPDFICHSILFLIKFLRLLPLIQIHPNINNTPDYFPVILQLLVVTVVVVVLAGVRFLKSRGEVETTGEVSESEKPSQPVSYKIADSEKGLIAAGAFVSLGIALVFLFSYAVNLKKLGWHGFVPVAVFILMIACGYFYAIKKTGRGMKSGQNNGLNQEK